LHLAPLDGLPKELAAIFKGLRMAPLTEDAVHRYHGVRLALEVSANGVCTARREWTGTRLAEGASSFLEIQEAAAVPLMGDLPQPSAVDLVSGDILSVEVEADPSAFQRQYRLWLRRPISTGEQFSVGLLSYSRVDLNEPTGCFGLNLSSYRLGVDSASIKMTLPLRPANARLYVLDQSGGALIGLLRPTDLVDGGTVYEHTVLNPRTARYFATWERADVHSARGGPWI
jgi:hypothetical protein